jgi:hypothetical protein
MSEIRIQVWRGASEVVTDPGAMQVVARGGLATAVVAAPKDRD